MALGMSLSPSEAPGEGRPASTREATIPRGGHSEGWWRGEVRVQPGKPGHPATGPPGLGSAFLPAWVRLGCALSCGKKRTRRRGLGRASPGTVVSFLLVF